MRRPLGVCGSLVSLALLALDAADNQWGCLLVDAKREGAPQLQSVADALAPPAAVAAMGSTSLLQERASLAASEAEDDGSSADDEEEEACEAQQAMSSFLQRELDKLQDPSSPWVSFLSQLASAKDNKETCIQASGDGSKGLCELPETSSGASQPLPCGGQEYAKLIEKYIRAKNCELSLTVSQTLMQNWTGHSGQQGIFSRLISLYNKAMEYDKLDSDLYYVYQDSAQLLQDLMQKAQDGVAAFHSLDIKAEFLKRRRELLGLLCALGRGAETTMSSDVVLADHVLVLRGNFEDSAREALAAFIAAIDAFGVYVQALLEEGGLIDRATTIHANYHKFRMQKLNALLTDIQPTAEEGDDSSALMDLVPHPKHKTRKNKHKGNKDGSQGEKTDAAEAAAPVFLEGAMDQELLIGAAPGAPTQVAAAPVAATPAAVPVTGAAIPAVAGAVPASTQFPAGVAQPAAVAPGMQQPQQQPSVASTVPVTAAAPSSPPAQGPTAPETATVFGAGAPSGSPATPTPTEATAATEGQTVTTTEATPVAAVPPPPPPSSDSAAQSPAAAPLPQQPAPGATPPPARAPQPTGTTAVTAGGQQGADIDIDADNSHSIPIRERVEDMVKKLKMFNIEDGKITYTANVTSLEHVIKAGYTDLTDRIFVEYLGILPQAFAVTTFKFISLLTPNPQVDFAEFYNSTLADDGSVTEGFEGEMPVNHKLLAERFSHAVDEAYKDYWRRYFADEDKITSITDPKLPRLSQPQPQQPQPQQQQTQQQREDQEESAQVSALEKSSGVIKPHSFVLTGEGIEEGEGAEEGEGEEFEVAIISSSDGVNPLDLEKYVDVAATNSLSLQALASAASTPGDYALIGMFISLACVVVVGWL